MNQNPEYYLLKGYISDLPEQDQTTIKTIKANLENILNTVEKREFGLIAISLLGMELQNE